MLQIQEELLKDTAFHKEAFEESKQKGEAQGILKGERATKLAMVSVLCELGLNDEVIAQKLQLPLADVQSVKPSWVDKAI